MSLQAMQWAMSKAPIKRNASQCRNRLVLLALADRYNDDTGVCWPSIKTISSDIGVSVQTVHKAISDLESAGLITRGNPHWVAHIRADRRPTVWTLNLEMVKPTEKIEPDNHVDEALSRGKDVVTPSDSRGKDVLKPRGKDVLTNGVKTCLHKPKENPKSEPKDLFTQPEVENENAQPPKKKKRSTATRLPDGWMPDEKVIAQMREECPAVNLEFEHRKFTDYWVALPDSRARKKDWNATWRNWIRNASQRRPQRGTSSSGSMDFVDLLNESRRQQAQEPSRGLDYPEHNWESRGELPW